MNLLETFSKLVNEDEDEDEEVRNKMLGSLEFLAIKNRIPHYEIACFKVEYINFQNISNSKNYAYANEIGFSPTNYSGGKK